MKITYKDLEKLKEYVNSNISTLPRQTYQSIVDDFEIKFTHESTKIEGNTLSISEVKTLLVDNISVGGKDLREIYEVINNQKANKYISEEIKKGASLTEDLIKDIHQIVTENIIQGGLYRNHNVRITGASFRPPDWVEVRDNMKWLVDDFNHKKSKENPIEQAAFLHAEFVRIHPFPDGNGRCARLLLNFILETNGYKGIIINYTDRPRYYESFDKYATNNGLDDFYNLILEKEYEVLEDYKDEIDKAKAYGDN